MMNATEEQYRKHWATLTGKSEREIYVPLALRTFEEGERVRRPGVDGPKGLR